MKLLFITHWSKNMLVFRSELLSELSRDHEVYVLCPLDEHCSQFEKLGVQHVPWNLKRAEWRNVFTAIRGLRRELRNINPDKSIVYCQQPILYFLIASYLMSIKEFFPVFTGFGSLFTDWNPPTLKKSFVRWCVKRFYGWNLERATRVLVLNEDDKREIAKWNTQLESKTFKTRGEGIDCDKFQPIRGEDKLKKKVDRGISENRLVVSFVGRFIGEKGILDFLELVKRVPAKLGVKFVVAGSSDSGNPSSVDSAIFTKFCIENDVLNLGWLANTKEVLDITDVFLFPSYREGLPIAPQEAMAMGISVVGYRCTGLSELFCGIDDTDLAACGDVTGLAEIVERKAAHNNTNLGLCAHIRKNYSLDVCNASFRSLVEI